jgi:hypothetical protein
VTPIVKVANELPAMLMSYNTAFDVAAAAAAGRMNTRQFAGDEVTLVIVNVEIIELVNAGTVYKLAFAVVVGKLCPNTL